MWSASNAQPGPRKRNVQGPNQSEADQPLPEYVSEPAALSMKELSLTESTALSNKTSPIRCGDQVCEKSAMREPKLVEQNAFGRTYGAIDPNTSDPFDETAVVPDADEEDDDPSMPTVTFRSCLVGLIMAVFGAAVCQIFMYKPVHLHPHPLFIQLACLIIGRGLAEIPGPPWWNPGPLTVKETVFSAIMATAGAAGTPSVEMVATQDLLFDRKMSPLLTITVLVSSQLIGYGWAGLLRPFLIYSPKTIFPSTLPSVALFKSLCNYSPEVTEKVSFFKKGFTFTTFYQVIPTYIAPALQAISPWCLTLPQVPAITNLFGGSLVAEGMGLFAFCSDWTLIGGHGPLFIPLIAQVTDWASVGFAIFLMGAAYRFNWFNYGGPPLPFISYDLLDSKGKRYNLTTAIFKNGTENVTSTEILGLPHYATTSVVGKSGISLAVSSAITTAIIYNWDDLRNACSNNGGEIAEDPHRKITKKYKQFPNWAFASMAVLFLALAFLCSFWGESGLSVGALATSFCISAVLSLAAGFFYGTVGIGLHCHPVVQMIGGLLFPGNAIGNMWFTMYGSVSVGQCVFMLKDLKLGQYMHLSSLSVVGAQMTGTLVGGFTHYLVMVAILSTQRDVLLLPNGNGVFTGMALSGFAANATTWGIFSQRLYLAGQRYAIVPICLLAGFFLPIPFVLLHFWKPKVGFNKVNVSLFCSSLFHAVGGVTSARTVATIIGFYTQYYMRKYRFQWYQKYNYILSAALDGGTQLTMFLLTFTLQGGAGFKLDMPVYFLNPSGTRDYCYLPSAKR